MGRAGLQTPTSSATGACVTAPWRTWPANIDRVHCQLAACADLVKGPMTYSEFYAAVVTAFDLPVGHPAVGCIWSGTSAPIWSISSTPISLRSSSSMGPRRSGPKGRCRVAKTVVLGLSGGVDSAVAARLLVEAGTPSMATGWTSA